jgi:hypothetical protein
MLSDVKAFEVIGNLPKKMHDISEPILHRFSACKTAMGCSLTSIQLLTLTDNFVAIVLQLQN